MPLTYYVETSESLSGPWDETLMTDIVSPSIFVGESKLAFWLRLRREINNTIEWSNAVWTVNLDAPVLSGTGGTVAFVSLSWTTTCADEHRLYRYNHGSHEYEIILDGISGHSYEDYDAPYNVTNYYYVVPMSSNGYEGPPSNIISVTLTSPGVFMSRATDYQGIQLGVESTPGTGVSANKRLRNCSLEYTPNIPKRKVYYPGAFAATDTQRGQEHTEFNLTGVLDFNHVCYWISSMFGVVTPSQAGTLDYTRTWTPSVKNPGSSKSFTIEQGSSAGAEKWTYVRASSLSIQGDKENLSIQGTMFGQETNRGITITSSPTEIAAKACDPYSVDIHYSTDNSTYTKLTDVLSWSIDFGTHWKPVFHQNSSFASYDDTVQMTPEDMGITLNFEEGSEGTTFYNYVKSHTKFYIRVTITGALIETGSPDIYHKIVLIMPVFAMEPSPGDTDDVWSLSIACAAAEDITVGMFNLAVTNLLTAASLGV